MRAKRLRVKMTFQAGAKVARLVKTAAAPFADLWFRRGRHAACAALRSADGRAKNLPREDVPSLLGLGPHAWCDVCDSHAAMFVVRALSSCTVDDENFAGSFGQAKGLHQHLEVCGWSRVRSRGLDDAFRVPGAVWHGIWDAQRCAELRICGSRRDARRASRRARQAHLGARGGQTPSTGTLTAPLKLAMQHLRTSGELLARGALESVFLSTRTQSLKWSERFSLDRSCQLCLAPDATHAGGPLVRSGRSKAHQAPARRLGSASRERRTWGLGTARDEREKEGHGEVARPASWSPPKHHSGGECRFFCGTCGTSVRWAALSTRTP